MKLLLDTHILVWLAEGLDDLPESSRERIDREAAGNGLAVSGITFWEVAMLADRKRISLSRPISDWRQLVLETPHIIEAPVTGRVGIEAVLLPGQLHADPADRMLVATARVNGWRLATRDQRLLDYGEEGHVSTIKL